MGKRRRFLALEQETQRLEQLAAEKTREIAEKNIRLEAQGVRLKELEEKLKMLGQLKSGYFPDISHQFRTALTLIMLPLERLLEKCQDKEQEERLNLMLQNAQQLLTLFNRLSHLIDVLSPGDREKRNEAL
jgi:signal transduction histidine kinase